MFTKVDKHSGIPAYVQIMNQIKKEIMMGNIKQNDQLLTIREMQVLFGVNINTVTRSLEKLVNENILEAKHGVGFFVNSECYVPSEVSEIIKNTVKELKKYNINKETSLLLFEEVWDNE